MCDSCLDDEEDVDRMALAQSDDSQGCNMTPLWVADPEWPPDPVDNIKHCACFLVAKEDIPANSKLSWYYPMVHKVTSCMGKKCIFGVFVHS
jgi:hypothetical protein